MAGSTQAEIPSQVGRTAVVTGATGGLGYRGTPINALILVEHLPNAPLANYPPWRSASGPPALLRHAKLFLEGGEGTHSQHRSCRLHHSLMSCKR
jgi:hypothetical protein